MKRDLRDSVVVITGASSGIGRAAAFDFADHGAHVVLAARRSEALDEVARECEAKGVRALAVPTDVRDPRAVEELAQQSVDAFGHLDTWVNNAAVSLFGRFEETPSDLFREVFETNLFGYVHGARAALPRFREQGAGVLINVSSVVGEVGQPYTTAYTSSKWAIRGLSESLRLELQLDEAPSIQVCTVLPAAIDTPLFQQAGNFTGRAVKAMTPTYDARMVARTIVDVAQKPRREVHAGSIGKFAPLARLLPAGLMERIFARSVDSDHFLDRPAQPTEGNIRHPVDSWRSIDGGWREVNGSNGDGPHPALFAIPPLLLGGAGLLAWRMRNGGDDGSEAELRGKSRGRPGRGESRRSERRRTRR